VFPVVFSKIKYYDEKTDTIDELLIIVHHLDGYKYEMTYFARLD